MGFVSLSPAVHSAFCSPLRLEGKIENSRGRQFWCRINQAPIYLVIQPLHSILYSNVPYPDRRYRHRFDLPGHGRPGRAGMGQHTYMCVPSRLKRISWCHGWGRALSSNMATVLTATRPPSVPRSYTTDGWPRQARTRWRCGCLSRWNLLYFPIALVNDYVLARAIWMTCLEIALIALAFLSLRLTGWKPGRIFLPVILLFPLLWVYGVFSLDSGSAAGFIALALAGFLLALRNESDELAGGLLILLVSSARFTGVLAFFIFWWIFYQRRWRVLWGFLMALAVLLGLAFLFLPGWFLPFLSGLLSHFSYNPGFTSTGIFASWSPVVGQRLGWVLAAVLLLVLFFEWGNTLAKDFRAFLWMVCLTVSVTPLLGIPMVPKEYVILILPLMLFLALLAERRPWLKRWGVPGIVLLILGGLWMLTLALVTANAYVAPGQPSDPVPAVLLVFGLYWMRWWFFHTVPTGLETPP